MKTCLRSDTGRSGSSLLTAMIVVVTISACLGTIAYTSGQRVRSAVKLGDRIRAQALAEAGANHAYSIIVTNWGLRTNSTTFPVSSTNYGGGSYIAYVQVPSITSRVVSIVSTGRCGTASSVAALEARNSGTGSPGWTSNQFQYAVLCGGAFGFGGCGTIAPTNKTAIFHSNKAITISGNANVGGTLARLDLESSVSILVKNNNTVNGDVTSPANSIKGTVLGTKTTAAVPVVQIPQIDLGPYYAVADAASPRQVFPAGWKPPYTPYTPPGGIIWIEGDSGTINGGVINGAIFATGSIHFSGKVDVTTATGSCGFVAVSRDGDIDNQSSGTLTGLVYAKTGNFKQTANGTLIGSLIVAGTVDKGGVSDVVLFSGTVPTLPGDAVAADNISIAGWTE